MENLKQASGEIEAQVRPPHPSNFLVVLCFVALVYKSCFFFQKNRFTEIIRHYILKQTL